MFHTSWQLSYKKTANISVKYMAVKKNFLNVEHYYISYAINTNCVSGHFKKILKLFGKCPTYLNKILNKYLDVKLFLVT